MDEFEHVDPAVEMGAFIKDMIAPATLKLEASQDVAGGRNGYLIGADVAASHKLSNTISASAQVFSTYASGGFMSTYFGVDRANSRRSG